MVRSLQIICLLSTPTCCSAKSQPSWCHSQNPTSNSTSLYQSHGEEEEEVQSVAWCMSGTWSLQTPAICGNIFQFKKTHGLQFQEYPVFYTHDIWVPLRPKPAARPEHRQTDPPQKKGKCYLFMKMSVLFILTSLNIIRQTFYTVLIQPLRWGCKPVKAYYNFQQTIDQESVR